MFSIEDGICALPDVIKALESVDVTSVRASTPLYLLCKHIRENYPVKVLLSGEGSDEAWCGYLENHRADRDGLDAGLASARRVRELSMYDIQRCNRMVPAHGLEIRVPFLDVDVLQMAMTCWPAARLPQKRGGRGGTGPRIEKFLLRNAFDETVHNLHTGESRPYLPDSVLWRTKEQFSDGCGYGWIDEMKACAARDFSSAEMRDAMTEAFGRAPTCPEQTMIMSIFLDVLGPKAAAFVGKSTKTWKPKWNDDIDPSGRAIPAHRALIDGGGW